MDQTHENFQKQKSLSLGLSLSQFIKSQILKMVITKLILSVSVFSLFFPHSTLFSLIHFVKFYFSTVPIKLLSHTLDKNCTFLLCNGLLVFLAKYSGLFSSSSSSSSKYNLTDHESYKNHADDSQPRMMMETTEELPLLEEETVVESTETRENAIEERETSECNIQEVPEKETEQFTEEKHEEQEGPKEEDETRDVFEENEEPAEGSFFIAEAEAREEEEEEEEEEGNGMSTEELNKKFDDFIRKMKEELRIEARQQLIMV